jgi:oligopeptide transport system permease protein
MMRIVDMMYAIPYLLIAILLVTILGREFYLVVITITVFSWMDMARVVRGQTLSLRSKEFVEAARAIGVYPPGASSSAHRAQPAGHCGDLHHRDRAGRDPDRVGAVVSGAGHSGAHDQLGRADSGRRQVMEISPWILLFPGLMLSAALYCFNYIGDGMRDALDPKDR